MRNLKDNPIDLTGVTWDWVDKPSKDILDARKEGRSKEAFKIAEEYVIKSVVAMELLSKTLHEEEELMSAAQYESSQKHINNAIHAMYCIMFRKDVGKTDFFRDSLD